MNPTKRNPLAHPLCQRVFTCLDEALATGELALPPLLEGHAAQCPRCAPEVENLHRLFARLRAGAATADLTPVAPAVDQVLAVVLESGARGAPPGAPAPRKPTWRWMLGQAAMVAALLAAVTGVLTWGAYRVAGTVAGGNPAERAARVVEPFRNLIQAGLHQLTGDVRK